MTNEEFLDLAKMLNGYYKDRIGIGLGSMHPGALVRYSKKMREELESWEREVVARAKAQHEHAMEERDLLRIEFGEEEFDSIEPCGIYGLDFGDTLK